MSEHHQPQLFEINNDAQENLYREMMMEYKGEIETMTVDQLNALKMEELETYSDTEARINLLNIEIENRSRGY